MRRLLALPLALLFAGRALADPSLGDDQHWQALARADIEAVHGAIQRAHPGAIDPLNPGFRVWMEEGYREALALVPHVYDYNSMLDAVRYYVVGFQDGHLGYSDDVRVDTTHNGSFPVVGWKVDLVKGKYVVTNVWKGFPSDLPPVGARLVQCDGRDPETSFRERIAPFFDLRPVDKALIAGLLTTPGFRENELRRCEFITPTGHLEIKVAYVPEPLNESFAFLQPVIPPKKRVNGFSFNDGVLWIRAASFSLSAEDARALNAMLDKIHRLKNVRAIVFDSRGNGGGDSGVGGRIFVAATGGLQYDRPGIERLPRVYAQWRVSDISVAAAANWVQQTKTIYGQQSPKMGFALARWDELRRAQAAGQQWYEQWEGPNIWGYRVDRDEMIRRHGRPKRFSGKVILLTDDHCASACLDFADAVRLVPGALHVGKTTSADAVYIQSGSVVMPSGNHLWIPLKVWRNRLRGNNEPLVPDISLDCDMEDDECVEAKTLALLDAK
jgi:Peptidase family S41